MTVSTHTRAESRSTLKDRVIHTIEGGLPLVERPYAAIAEQLGTDEGMVISIVRELLDSGVIKRIGVVVRHHELGYRANAMVVWNVDDDMIDELGESFGHMPFVTLCYQRPRRLPDWPYNLFTMIHGGDRDRVLAMVRILNTDIAPTPLPHEILFSGRRFKQRGARYRGDTSSDNKVVNLLMQTSMDDIR
ncbi:MAG: protein NirL [marine bacterium B5-7]|nr:MAG: protein NirL [marine bacterium B5-7]